MSESRAATPAPDGSPPLPDGHVVPQPPRGPLPLATREVVYGALCVALVVAAVLIGVLR